MDRKCSQNLFDGPILQLSDSWKLRDFVQGGVLIFGSLGAGKTRATDTRRRSPVNDTDDAETESPGIQGTANESANGEQ